MKGKTIATSLAGEGPSTLKKLSSNTSNNTFTSELLGNSLSEQSPNKKTPDGKGYEFSKSLAIIGGNKYKIDYKVTSSSYTPEICATAPCYNCVVDVETSFKEKPCADELSKAPSFTFRRQTGACAPRDSAVSLYDATLTNGGTYVISKKLKVNEEKLDKYTQEYLSSACVKDLNYFINDEMAKADPNWCGLSCDQCKDKFTEVVGTYAQWSAKYDIAPPVEQYNKLRDQACIEFCDTKWNDCSIALELMTSDMAPMGQYGEIYENSFKKGHGDDLVTVNANGMVEVNTGDQLPDLNTGASDSLSDDQSFNFDFGAFNPEVHSLSIYKTQNVLPKRDIPNEGAVSPGWRNPRIIENGVVTAAYLNDDGTRSFISIVEVVDASGTVTSRKPAVNDASKIIREANRAPYIYPENLLNVFDFSVTYWKSSWARSLVVYHPEYPYYQQCIENMASVEFDQKWNSTYTLSKAEENGMMNRNVSKFNPLAVDPYFNSGRKLDSLWMRKRLNVFQKGASGETIDLWTLVNRTVNCPTNKNCTLGCSDTK
ncbi:MAG TPA: hypothetical protein VL947_11690, partial [Cytophagales bacterium]|nr:hypothetical protein [Cytophagales bacterium]